jgi:hypothetical protein
MGLGCGTDEEVVTHSLLSRRQRPVIYVYFFEEGIDRFHSLP